MDLHQIEVATMQDHTKNNLKSIIDITDTIQNNYTMKKELLDEIEIVKTIYSEIENLIINWNNDGTKTTGSLTREIMIVLSSLIDKTNEENNKKEDFEIETRFGTFRLRAYQQTTNKQVHLALTKGSWNLGEPILTRINSTQANNDILNTLTAAMDKKMDNVFNRIIQEGKGAVLFINQEVDSSDLLHRLRELKHLQSQGNNRVPQIKMDVKDFGIGAQILHDIDISRIRLISNTTQTKRVGMIGYGLEITEYVVY